MLMVGYIFYRSNVLLKAVELIAKYGLACLERGDTDLSVIIEANGVLAKNVKNIHMFKDVLNDISSTKIR